jgi:hypothetical protein
LALSEAQRADVERRLTAYCALHPPPRVRDRVRSGFEIRGSYVVLFEKFPALNRRAGWIRHGVAKFRWVATQRHWELYCQFRDLKWHRYEPRPTAGLFRTLLREVDADPTGIFWG